MALLAARSKEGLVFVVVMALFAASVSAGLDDHHCVQHWANRGSKAMTYVCSPAASPTVVAYMFEFFGG
jgi:hypothetical protein